MRNATIIAGLATLALTGMTMAQTKTYEGPGGDIPDNDPNGLRSEIVIDESGEIASFKSITIFGFNHTWAGDLQIFLTHKDTGTTVTLLDRPGVPETGFGDSADFAGDYDWIDGGFVYDADLFDEVVPNVDPFGPVQGTLNDFAGEDKLGTWSLTIIDNAGGDTGSIAGWQMVINNVPAPGALALLGMAGLIGTRRRR